MGLRFRKSFKLGKGFRVNLSKSGVGISGGTKGFRVGVGPRGTRTTASIPGTGISYVKEQRLGSSQGSKTKPRIKVESNYTSPSFLSSEVPKELKGKFYPLQSILGGVGIVFIFLTFLNPRLFLFGIAAIYGKGAWRKSTDKEAKSYRDALNYFKTKKYDKCIEALDHVLKHPSANKDLNLTKAECFLEMEEFDQAYFIYKEYFNRFNPVHLDIQQYWSPKASTIALSIEKKDYDFALKIIETLPEDTVDDIDFTLWKNYFKGQCFIGKGQYEVAIEAFKNAVGRKRRMEEPYIDCHYNMGVAYWKIGKKSLATKKFQRVYTANTSYKNIHAIIDGLEKNIDLESLF
ncbi:MAG: DUF4236 domain-containing protein [Clostridiaceae bacterium]|nr:DUF4236 domain-containing protein [Clostridiaceae bacterium]